MNAIRFYIEQVGKRCGHIDCKNAGWLPAYSFEKYNRGLWVSCGRIHKGAMR